MHIVLPARRPIGRAARWLAVALAGTLAACSDGVSTGNTTPASSTAARVATFNGSGSGAARPVTQPANTSGRLLASNCFQCHGTLGRGGFDSIRGDDAEGLLDYLNEPASSDIMAAHAQGFTRAQLQLIIDYLKQ